MQQLTVELADRSYPIYIGERLLHDAVLLAQHIPAEQVLIVSNEIVAPLYLEQTLQALKSFNTQTVILPDGEDTKSLDTLKVIYDALMQHRFDRQSTLLALGGGVIGDITGFAAATYQRGVNFIQIPTTLLAQVDSSVGGKTGVNHPQGKNMIGAFYQPLCVIADTATLNTLDDRQLRAGIAEVIKYGLIRDAQFFAWLEENINALLNRNPTALAYAIEHSCRNKAEVVSADERESGVRATLNLGHTFGHAIESGMGYGQWLHGEAVATGMLMAAHFSHQLGLLDESALARTHDLIQRAQLPVHAPTAMDAQTFLKFMSADKKVKHGRINLVLLNQIGNALITSEYDTTQLHAFLASFPRQ